MKGRSWNKRIAPVIAFCFLSVQLALCFPTPAQAGSGDDLKSIEYDHYFRGDYERATKELRAFLKRKDLSAAQIVEAREYLAASLVLSGETAAGQAEFLTLINDDPDYPGPDPSVFKAAIISVFEDARAEYASNVIRTVPESAVPAEAEAAQTAVGGSGKPLYKKWWFYLTMGAVVLVIAAAAGGGGSDSGGSSPETGSVGVDVQVQ